MARAPAVATALIGAAVLVRLASPYSFVSPLGASGGVPVVEASQGIRLATRDGSSVRDASPPGSPSSSSLPLLSLVSAAALLLVRHGSGSSRQSSPVTVVGLSPPSQSRNQKSEALISMGVVPKTFGGGRRGRLGVAGRTCMLTGKKKIVGYYRTYSENKKRKVQLVNLRWRKVWWDEEQDWVRLYISEYAAKECDVKGLQYMANKVGLDLYAWRRPHWMPGSKQPLPLKVSKFQKAQQTCRRFWPKYKQYLNKGRPMAEVVPLPAKWLNPGLYPKRNSIMGPEGSMSRRRLEMDDRYAHLFIPKSKCDPIMNYSTMERQKKMGLLRGNLRFNFNKNKMAPGPKSTRPWGF